ncbi:MAG: putative DNA binding domain-containing protein [Bacillota bacterium]
MESNRVEYKRELNERFENELVAFLNYSEGGEIHIGVNDDGVVCGVDNIDDVQLRIKDIFNDRIAPATLGLYDIVVDSSGVKDFIRIIIASGSEKPYYVKRFGMSENGCYIRVGSSCIKMNQGMIENLFAKRARNSLRQIRSPRQDLTFSQLKIYYQEKGKELNDRFAQTLEFLTQDGSYNYVAYLFADENGNSMKVAKYLGTDKYELIENKEFGYCSLIKSVKNILDRLDVENTTFAKITAKDRKELSLVNEVALKEIFINAVVHNDYAQEVPPVVEIFADRIEVTSTGSLVPGMSQDDFFSGYSMPRNREIMRIFKDLELVEHLGSGLLRILKHYDKSNFIITPNFLRVVLPFSSREELGNDTSVGINVGLSVGIKLTETERLVYGMIKSDTNIVTTDIAAGVGKSQRTVERAINQLKKLNVIARDGSKKDGKWEIK